MTCLTSTRDPVSLSRSVAHYTREGVKFMAAVKAPQIAGPDTYYLYGSTVSCTDAMIEAMGDHPGADRAGEFEYLPPEEVRAMRAKQAAIPRGEALRNLGLVKPDGTPLR